jgi:hypothetical protein
MQDTLPDYHFLLIASNLDAEWFFDAARAYWERFRPTVVSDLSLVSLLPEEDVSVVVTVIARRDRVAQLGVDLSRLRPEALFDPVVHDFIADAKQALDERARLNQPFGVPLIPTETPIPAPTSVPLFPTPGPVVGGSGSDFITQTPTPPGLPAQDDPDVTNLPPTPIFPTPGPVIGGDN